MKSRFFLTAGFALSLLCAACSDDSASINPIDAGKDDGKVAEDTVTHMNPNVETENGATFETKGSGYSDDFGGRVGDVRAIYDSYDSYKGGAMVEAGYDESFGSPDVYTTVSESYTPIDYEVLTPMPAEGSYNGKTHGLLTASEWNDLDHWGSWAEILTGEFADKTSYWKFFPTTLAVVKVVDKDGAALANVSVELLKGDEVEFATKTDNTGRAYCWVNLFDGSTQKSLNAEEFSLKVNGKVSEATIEFTLKSDNALKINVITSDAKQPEAKADVAFIVDATGSMGDEIQFLKSDIKYIIDHAHSDTKVALRSAVEFYRDESDEYIIQGKDFSTDVANTQAFIADHFADGGGDYPEAVHTALESALQNFSWNESARSRIAFLILDAPAHHQDDVIESLQESIILYAKNGIKLIPVAASGVDKDTESMLRFFEIVTGGTYVFLTDDSGIGYSHIEASVGDHDVEKLADLMVRLIKKYVE